MLRGVSEGRAGGTGYENTDRSNSGNAEGTAHGHEEDPPVISVR